MVAKGRKSEIPRMGVTLLLVSGLIVSALLLGSGLERADGSLHRTCGKVVFEVDDYYESAGYITASGVGCGEARKLMVKCGRKGLRPAGRSAAYSVNRGTLTLSRSGKRIVAKIAGPKTPGTERCT